MVCGQSEQSKWYTTQICRMLRTRHCALEHHEYLLDYKGTSLNKTPKDYVVASNI